MAWFNGPSWLIALATQPVLRTIIGDRQSKALWHVTDSLMKINTDRIMLAGIMEMDVFIGAMASVLILGYILDLNIYWLNGHMGVPE